MNMQPVNGVFIKSVKDRQKELGAAFQNAYAQIQYAQDDYDRRRTDANHQVMTREEFNIVFPPPEGFAATLSQINSDKATLASLEVELSAWKALYASANIDSPEKRTAFYAEHGVGPRTEDGRSAGEFRYYIQTEETKIKPWLPETDVTRLFKDSEFIAQHPKPAHDSFVEQHTIINDAKNESTSLQAFIESGVNGLHDVDLLSGTAISYS